MNTQLFTARKTNSLFYAKKTCKERVLTEERKRLIINRTCTEVQDACERFSRTGYLRTLSRISTKVRTLARMTYYVWIYHGRTYEQVCKTISSTTGMVEQVLMEAPQELTKLNGKGDGLVTMITHSLEMIRKIEKRDVHGASSYAQIHGFLIPANRS